MVTFTVPKISNWRFQFGHLDSGTVRSVGSNWEITLPTSDSTDRPYGIGLLSTVTGALGPKDDEEVKVATTVRDSTTDRTDLLEIFEEIDKEFEKEFTGGENLVVDADISKHRHLVSGVGGIQSGNTPFPISRLEIDSPVDSLVVSSAGITMESRRPISGNIPSGQDHTAGGKDDRSSQLSMDFKAVHLTESSSEAIDVSKLLSELAEIGMEVSVKEPVDFRTVNTCESEVHQPVSRILTTSGAFSDGSSTSAKPQAIYSGQCHPISGNLDTENTGERLLPTALASTCEKPDSEVLSTGLPNGTSCSFWGTLPRSGKCDNCHYLSGDPADDELGELPPPISTELKWFELINRPSILTHFETLKPGLPSPVLPIVNRPAPPPPLSRPISRDIDGNKATGFSRPVPYYRELSTFQSPARRISVDDVPNQSGKLVPRPPRTYTFVSPSVEMPPGVTTVVQKQEKEKKKSIWSWKKETKKDAPKTYSEAEELEVVWNKKKKK